MLLKKLLISKRAVTSIQAIIAVIVVLVATVGGTVYYFGTIPNSEPLPYNIPYQKNYEVKTWLLEIAPVSDAFDATDGIGDTLINLIGAKITRDQALNQVDTAINEISKILSDLKTVEPPAVAYQSDLQEAQSLLIQSLETRLSALETTRQLFSLFPTNGGLTMGDEVTNLMTKATSQLEESNTAFSNAVEKLQSIFNALPV